MSLSRADRRAKERRDKRNKRTAKVVSVSMLTSMGIAMAPAGAFAAVITLPLAPTVIDSCGVANDRSILQANADVLWYEAVDNGDGTETLVAVDGEVAATGLDVEFVAQPAVLGDTFADGSVEVRFPVTYTDEACITVTAEDPTFLDYSGTDNDRVVIPGTVGVQFAINGTPVAPGTYPASGTVTVTALPEDGYELAPGSPTNWTNDFNPAVTATVVVAADPIFTDESGTVDDVVIIPDAEGVVYSLNGDVVAAGEYPGVGTATVEVAAASGYELDPDEPATFNFTFDAAVTDTVVTPAAPVFTDESGTADDVVTIPASEGVQYTLNGDVVAAGDYPGTGAVVVEAVATAGYDLDPDAPSTFNFTFDATVDDVIVTPAAPVFTDELGTVDDVVVIPDSEGVQYTLNGDVVGAGEYPGDGTVTVVATATEGFALDPDATSTWNFTFDTAADAVVVTPAAPIFTDLPGTADDVVVIPDSEGVEYTLNGDVVAAGEYPGTGTVAVEAVATTGFELDPEATTLWNFVFDTSEADTVVTPAAPVFTDESGTENDKVTIPNTAGVNYFIDDVATEPGTYDATGTIVVRAEAEDGYALDPDAPSTWTSTFSTAVDAEEVVVEVETPTFSGELNVVTIPDVEGLQFFLNGEAVSAGSYPITEDAVVTATVKPGYTVPDGTVLAWNYAFTAAPVDETPVDETPVDETPVNDGTPVTTPVLNTGTVTNTSTDTCDTLGGPFTADDPEYTAALDGDGDGVACESGSTTPVGTTSAPVDTLANTGVGSGMVLLLGAGALLTAGGAGTLIAGRRRKDAEA